MIKCAHFGVCGGCAQQDVPHEEQVATKQKDLLSQIQPATVLEPITGPIWGYRNKARMGAKYVIKKEKVLVGFREKKKSYIAELDQCEILNPSVGYMLNDLKALIQSLECYNKIPQIEVANGDDRLALIFRNMEELSASDKAKVIDFAKLKEFDFYLQPKGPTTVTKIWPDDNNPRLYYSIPDYNIKMAFHPMDFTQVNSDINKKMIKQAINLLDLNSGDKVLDLFSGIGNFTLPMATVAGHVTGVEGSEEMVKRGYENAKSNNIENVQFFAEDLYKPNIQAEFLKQSYTKVLIDPPRSGAEEVLGLIAGLNVDKILYVSCNPKTLARDTKILIEEHGYILDSAGIMDMFPHTMHVEAMALFNGKNS